MAKKKLSKAMLDEFAKLDGLITVMEGLDPDFDYRKLLERGEVDKEPPPNAHK